MIEAEAEMLAALLNYIGNSPDGKICTVPTKDMWNLSAFYAANAHIEKGTFRIKAFCTKYEDKLS